MRRAAWRGAAAIWLAAAAAACGGEAQEAGAPAEGAAAGRAPGEGASRTEEGGPAGATGRAPGEGAPRTEESGAAGETGRAQERREGAVEVNEFLRYHPGDSLAELELWAGWRGANAAWNFDGYYGGNATVMMPLGWQVVATFQNLDANVPHSVGIIEETEPVPVSGSEATMAFRGAVTGNFTAGFSSREKPQTFRFVPNREGRFLIYCGVPGHGPGGMWIWFEVSEGAAAPEFRTE